MDRCIHRWVLFDYFPSTTLVLFYYSGVASTWSLLEREQATSKGIYTIIQYMIEKTPLLAGPPLPPPCLTYHGGQNKSMEKRHALSCLQSPSSLYSTRHSFPSPSCRHCNKSYFFKLHVQLRSASLPPSLPPSPHPSSSSTTLPLLPLPSLFLFFTVPSP